MPNQLKMKMSTRKRVNLCTVLCRRCVCRVLKHNTIHLDHSVVNFVLFARNNGRVLSISIFSHYFQTKFYYIENCLFRNSIRVFSISFFLSLSLSRRNSCCLDCWTPFGLCFTCAFDTQIVIPKQLPIPATDQRHESDNKHIAIVSICYGQC